MPGLVPGIHVFNIFAALTQVNLHALSESLNFLFLLKRKLYGPFNDQGMKPFQSNAELPISYEFVQKIAIVLIDLCW